MTAAEFEASLDHAVPPEGQSPMLQALWWARKGNWNRAHELAQAQDDSEGAWVHSYLHRVEGDEGNAGYWYRRAGRPFPNTSLDAEWRAMVVELLGQG